MNLKIEFSAKTNSAGKHRILTGVCAAYVQRLGYIPPTWVFVSYGDDYNKEYAEKFGESWNCIKCYYTTDIRKIYQLTKPRNKAERQLTTYLKGVLNRKFILYKHKKTTNKH